MEILQSYSNDRQGNDCLIKESIALICVELDFYIVIHATQVVGSWTDNSVETRYKNFNSHENAKKCFNGLYKQIK